MIWGKYAKKQIKKQFMTKSLEKRFVENGYAEVLNKVYYRAAELFEENATSNSALQKHLNQLLPCIAFYETLIDSTIDKDEALQTFDNWAFDELKKVAFLIQKIAKVGLYKKFPTMFDKLIDKSFGAKAGFVSKSVEGGAVFSRDMMVCPYFETCQKYGCPELTQFFCKSDDVIYGNIHPNLIWGRTKTLGTGGNCCDFRLHLRE